MGGGGDDDSSSIGARGWVSNSSVRNSLFSSGRGGLTAVVRGRSEWIWLEAILSTGVRRSWFFWVST